MAVLALVQQSMSNESFREPFGTALTSKPLHLFLHSCGYSEKLDLILHHELFVGRKSK